MVSPWLKTGILIALCTQNASYTLLRKLSTMTTTVNSKEILLVGEILKLVVSGGFVMVSKEPSSSKGEGVSKLLWVAIHSGKMFVLAGIYLVMNVLSFVSLQYIGAGEFTVCAQLKILTTASFSVIIMGTKLSETKWRALALLVVGCILVAIPGTGLSKEGIEGGAVMTPSFVVGYGAVLMEVVLSGFASIYFEKVVKSTTEVVTIWERNFQLSIYSILIYGGLLQFQDLPAGSAGSWSGWNMITFVVAALGALGGLLVAASLKYADSILKTLATAGAIIIATFCGHFLLGSPLTHDVVLGACVTIIAILNYTKDQEVQPLSSNQVYSTDDTQSKLGSASSQV
eukprot:CAMPEP_0185028504 /NCGR_PEP_ID=MMETSP1103-20130426/14241_1 /TAXON_ID=36769 /ORGANISM="Paraphysomonas bandaiensis, Strain Caron Lab Isolate" /LENGTH=342 /DNA_ID=CAMNT_0027562931 /DNA_START=55 /DNA_END=1083 /DNA_ORIENTATION=+